MFKRQHCMRPKDLELKNLKSNIVGVRLGVWSPTRANAEAAITEYIEIFYNRQRRHSRLGYISPARFAEKININA